MPGKLGSGENRAAVYTKGGGTQLITLEATSQLTWARARNAFSVAKVTVTADDDHFGQLGEVHAWQHELVIFRDHERVWEGPLRFLDYGRGDTVLYAVDVLGWLAERRVRLSRMIAEGHETAVTDEMELALTRAFATDDPGVLANRFVVHHSGEAKITRDVKANATMADSDFTSMAGQGGNFTVVGRRVAIFPDEVLMGRTETLTDEHTTSEIRVHENGDALATNVAAVNSDGRAQVVIATSADVDPVTAVSDTYGLHDAIVGADAVKSGAGLSAIARAAVAQMFPTPVALSVPGDSPLNPNAPMRISELVPGTMIPVETSATPRRASGTMILDSVTVTQTPENGEQVAITVANPSAYAGSEDGG